MTTHSGVLALRTDTGFEFWADDGKVIPVAETDAPIEVPLVVAIEDGRIVEWGRDNTKPVAYRDLTRKDIAFICVTSRDRSDAYIERRRRTTQDTAKKLQDHVRWQAQGQWEVTVTPYHFIVDDAGDYGLNGPWGEIKDMIAAEAPDNDHNYWHLSGASTGTGAAGIAYVGSDKALTASPGNWDTAIHEQFHNFGLHHHSTPSSEYGGRYSWMGNGDSITGTGLHYLRLIPDHHTVTVEAGEPVRAFLVAPEAHAASLYEGEHKVVYFKTPDRWYAAFVVESSVLIASGSAQDRHTPLDPPWRRTYQIDILREGDSFQGLRVESARFGEAVVAIGEPGETATPAFEPPARLEPMAGKSGWWHNPNWDHQGVEIYVIGDEVAGALFTYNAAGPTWMIFNGAIRDGVAEVTFQAPDGRRALRDVGTGYLYFTGEHTGELIYHVDLGDRYWPGRGHFPLTRLANQGDHPLNGRYAFRDRPHEGLTVFAFPTGRVVLIWWGYVFENFQPRPTWWLAEGERGKTLTLYAPVGGMANTDTDSRLERWGECEVIQKQITYKKDGWNSSKRQSLNRII